MPPPRPHSSIPLRPSSEEPRARSPHGRPSHGRNESQASSFYNPTPRVEAGSSRYAGGRRESAYSGRRDRDEEEDYRPYRDQEEEAEEDVYADFNNMGPRIATAPLGSGMEGESMVPASSRSRPGAGGDRASTYRPGSVYAEPYLAQPAYGRGEPIRLPSSALMGGPSLYKSGGRMEDDSTASLLGGGTSQKGMTAAQMEIAELVTVPVLGAEWKRSELHNLSKKGRAEERAMSRRRKWLNFKRDDDRSFCCGWSLHQVLVWGFFGFVIALGLTLYFVLPRYPTFSFNATQPLRAVEGSTNSSSYILFTRAPTANFTFPAVLNLQADTGSTYIPVHLSKVDATVFDANTQRQVGSGLWSGTLPAKALTEVNIPLVFSYAGINSSDLTWIDYYNSCAHIYPGTVRPTLNIRVVLSMKANGLLTTSGSQTQISNIECPYQLPTDSA